MKAIFLSIIFFVLGGVSIFYFLELPKSSNTSTQNVEIQHSNETTDSKPNTASTDGSLVESLKQELATAKLELRKLQTSYDKLNSQIELHAKRLEERKANVLKGVKSERNLELQKKRWVSTSHNAAREIAESLSLTNEQLSAFKKLLESKASQYIDVMSTNAEINEKYRRIDENLANFRASILNLLDDEQILKYEEFELEKAKHCHQNRLEIKKNRLISKIPNLSEEQKIQISDFYRLENTPPHFGSIGVYGTAYESYKHDVRYRHWFQNELSEIIDNVGTILDANQYDALNN